MADSPFPVRLGPSASAKLTKLAAKSGLRKSDIIRLAVERVLAEYGPGELIAAVVASKTASARAGK
jgi:hypothetical protein